MYTLTLTLDERKAIDWVGHRDWNGDDLRKLLWDLDWKILVVFKNKGTARVLMKGDDGYEQRPNVWGSVKWELEIDIPEHVAWEIFQLWHEAGQTIPHFAPELKTKIQKFLDSIV